MNSAKRREDKKRRREKRQAKRQRVQPDLTSLVKTLDRISEIAPPATFPGASDPVLSRPDLIKLEYAQWISQGPMRERARQFERRVQQGFLHFHPEIDHWAMEEYFWHGAPDQSAHPIDAFLAAFPSRFSAAAQEQIRLWKQARLGFFEVSDCANDLIGLRECDPITLEPIGRWIEAIALNMGGVNDYAQQKGLIALAYVSPWSPERGIYCAMGYGRCLTREECAFETPLVLGMRDVEAIGTPLPWNVGQRALQEYAERWRKRDWHAWMRDNVRCPFRAMVSLDDPGPIIITITQMLTDSADEARHMGIYFEGRTADGEVGAFGGTAIVPLDFESPTAIAFAEYQAYRVLVGPPPASRGLV